MGRLGMRFLTGVCLAAGLGLAASCQRGGESGEGPGGSRPAEQAAVAPDRPSADSLGAKAGPEAAAAYTGAFEAFGVEPDWRLDLVEGWASFSRTGLEEVGGLPGPLDVRVNGAMLEAGPVAVTLKAVACPYGEGQSLPYQVSVFFEGVTYEGCGRRVEGEGGARAAAPNWTARLEALLPAIDACLARVEAGDRPAMVTIAYELEDGAVAVRLRDRGGGRSECLTLRDGSAVTGFDAIGDRNVLQGEREPMFTRLPDEPPSGACYASEPALAGDGATLGVLTRRTC